MNKTKDENQLAKSVIDDIIDWAESDNFIETKRQKIAPQGGYSRSANLSDLEKSEIAKKAAKARWEKESFKTKKQ
jgi:hypothetical protein